MREIQNKRNQYTGRESKNKKNATSENNTQVTTGDLVRKL